MILSKCPTDGAICVFQVPHAALTRIFRFEAANVNTPNEYRSTRLQWHSNKKKGCENFLPALSRLSLNKRLTFFGWSLKLLITFKSSMNSTLSYYSKDIFARGDMITRISYRELCLRVARRWRGPPPRSLASGNGNENGGDADRQRCSHRLREAPHSSLSPSLPSSLSLCAKREHSLPPLLSEKDHSGATLINVAWASKRLKWNWEKQLM